VERLAEAFRVPDVVGGDVKPAFCHGSSESRGPGFGKLRQACGGLETGDNPDAGVG
jgi:hypothetical protein